ncbi:hypothetical protein [Nonomuraea rubra]
MTSSRGSAYPVGEPDPVQAVVIEAIERSTAALSVPAGAARRGEAVAGR